MYRFPYELDSAMNLMRAADTAMPSECVIVAAWAFIGHKVILSGSHSVNSGPKIITSPGFLLKIWMSRFIQASTTILVKVTRGIGQATTPLMIGSLPGTTKLSLV